jgi:curved DNA-binding protein CbpA
MKFDSPLFDRIRVKPDQDRRVRTEAPACQWPGCAGEASHRAPKGRLREGEYWRFCLAHVREYNQSYNYFAGMSDEAVARFQKDSITGHRPTWKLGLNGKQPGDSRPSAGGGRMHGAFTGAADPFGVFTDIGGSPRSDPAREGRMVRNAERKALDTLGLEIHAKAPDIKARFKLLVKRHHPDANGGDRTCEDKLREIIQAYNYLKSAGFC